MMQNQKKFNLNSKDRSIVFSFQNCSSYISIQRIIIDNLLDYPKEDWFYQLYKLNICVVVSEKGEYQFPFNNLCFTFMSVDRIPKKPIYHFENDFIIPVNRSQNESNNYFCKEVEIELKPIKGHLDENISLTFYYEEITGVVWKN